MRQVFDEAGDARAALAHQRQRAAKDDGEQQHLQHIAIGEGAHGGGGDELEQKVAEAATRELAGVVCIGAHRLGVERLRVHIHAHTGFKPERERQAQHQRDGGDHLEVDQRLDAHAAHTLQVARARDAVNHHTKDDERDQHLDELDETIAQRLELHGRVGPEQPDGHASNQGQDHPAKQ
ncbi:hypothetical protein D3C71_1332390 [compost metagenome]